MVYQTIKTLYLKVSNTSYSLQVSYNGYYTSLPRMKWRFDSAHLLETFIYKLYQPTQRDRAMAARVAHNHEVPGSSPGPATK